MIKLLNPSVKKILFGVFVLSLSVSAKATLLVPPQLTLLHLRCGYYIAASGDVAWHNNIVFRPKEGGFTRFHYDIGQAVNFSLGLLCQHWRFEVEGSYRKNNLRRVATEFLSERATGFVRDFALMGNIYWDVYIPNSFWIVYVGGGAGVTFNRREVAPVNFGSMNDIVGGTSSSTVGRTNNDLWAWQAMAGVSYEIVDHTFISLGYRLFMSAKPRSSPRIVKADTIVWANNIEVGVRIEI